MKKTTVYNNHHKQLLVIDTSENPFTVTPH